MRVMCFRMGIKIDISPNACFERVPSLRKDLTTWLDKQHRSMENLEHGFTAEDKDNVYTGLACMDIEIETAVKLAREGDMNATAHCLAGAKRTKDFIYGNLMECYGGVQQVLSNGVGGNMGIWRDYITEKFDGGVRQCDFILQNLS